MKNYAIQELKDEFKRQGFQWLQSGLIGIRSKDDSPDVFDDQFYLVSDGVLKGPWTGTTNPGAYYLQNFISQAFNATAIMACQQVIEGWELGLIHGVEGWRQCKPLQIFRDANKDLKSDEVGIPQWASKDLCLHIHAMFGSAGASWKIWNWSAACQGLNQKSQWDEFMIASKKAGRKLSYSLIREF